MLNGLNNKTTIGSSNLQTTNNKQPTIQPISQQQQALIATYRYTPRCVAPPCSELGPASGPRAQPPEAKKKIHPAEPTKLTNQTTNQPNNQTTQPNNQTTQPNPTQPNWFVDLLEDTMVGEFPATLWGLHTLMPAALQRLQWCTKTWQKPSETAKTLWEVKEIGTSKILKDMKTPCMMPKGCRRPVPPIRKCGVFSHLHPQNRCRHNLLAVAIDSQSLQALLLEFRQPVQLQTLSLIS